MVRFITGNDKCLHTILFDENRLKLHFPSVAALCKSFVNLSLSQGCPRFVFICPFQAFSVLVPEMSSCCPCSFLSLPLSLHRILLKRSTLVVIEKKLGINRGGLSQDYYGCVTSSRILVVRVEHQTCSIQLAFQSRENCCRIN